jgi:hypothetical protein
VGVAAFGDQDVDDLTVPIDGAIQIDPAATDLDVGLVDEPAVAGCVPGGAGRVDELRREGLHPSVDRDVVDGDAPFSE